MVIALLGILWRAFSNCTGCRKLFTKYSAEQYLAKLISLSSSLSNVEIHFRDRSRGVLITYSIEYSYQMVRSFDGRAGNFNILFVNISHIWVLLALCNDYGKQYCWRRLQQQRLAHDSAHQLILSQHLLGQRWYNFEFHYDKQYRLAMGIFFSCFHILNLMTRKFHQKFHKILGNYRIILTNYRHRSFHSSHFHGSDTAIVSNHESLFFAETFISIGASYFSE